MVARSKKSSSKSVKVDTSTASKSSQKGRKILVMEDEPILSQALTIELNSYGYEVSVADNGEDGMNMLYKNPPDLLLLDLLMPKKNGYEVLQELKAKKLFGKMKVIVFSNLGQEEEKKKAIALGAKHFFVKSAIDLEDLVAFIQKLLK
jgi:DNA-binding response OmpR family regulator